MTIRSSYKALLDLIPAVIQNVLGILVIAIVSWNFTSGLQQVLDIGLNDESRYLWWGVTLNANGLPDAANAPLYAIWYHVLSFLRPDRIELFYLNCKILNILPALLLYAFLRAQRVRPIVSVFAACVFVVSQGNLYTWPKVSHFALCIILGGLTLASLATTSATVFAVLVPSALAASYVRPEYFIAFLIYAFAFCVVMFRQRQWNNRRYIAFSVVAAIAVLLLVKLGYPLSGESGRSFLAFQQHFSLNWVNWTQSDLNPWSDSAQIVQNCFGNAHSTIECALHDPILVAKHVLSNILLLPGKAMMLLLYPSRPYEGSIRYSRLLGTHFLFVIALAILVFGKVRLNTIKTTWPLVSSRLLGVGIFVVPPLLASILIYPRSHYLLLFMVPFFAAVMVLVRDCDAQPERGASLFILLVGLLFLFQTPVMSEPSGKLHVRKRIDFLGSLQVHKKVQLLEAEGGFHYYLPANWSRVAEYEKSESYTAFAEHRGVNAVIISESLYGNYRFKCDSQWHDFLSNPTNAGFTGMDIPGTPWQLLIRKELLSQEAGNAEAEPALNCQ